MQYYFGRAVAMHRRQFANDLVCVMLIVCAIQAQIGIAYTRDKTPSSHAKQPKSTIDFW